MEENNSTSITWPLIDWCFNMEMWLHTMATQNISTQMRTKYAHYKVFSYRYNGLLTLMLTLLGLTGSSLLLKQIYGSRVFSKRLAVHLGMICFWDMLYLLCCLSTYCIPSLIYSVTPIYGPFSYILFFLQPFASFCVSCTIWQVFAITLERYLAVSSPLEQRTRKAKFGVGWICVAITICAFILNLLPVPFENELVDCYEIVFDSNGAPMFRNHTMMKPYFDDKIRIYRFLVHFFPDLLFRAPTPIIVIGTMTVRTIQACSQRSVGNFQIGMRFNRNMPLRLSLLNFKFILCNTLYMFNTILLELLEYGNMDNGDYDGYINSFYLTDASNMLLVVHSATNWLLFYKFPSCRKKDSISMTLSTSIKYSSIKHRVAEHISKQVSPLASALGVDIIHKLCEDIPEVKSIIHGKLEKESEQNERETLVGLEFGHFIRDVFRWFGDRNRRVSKKIIYKQYSDAAIRGKINFKAPEWKIIRTTVVEMIVTHLAAHAKETNSKGAIHSKADIEECATRVFNQVLSEMKNVALCANVEEKQKARAERFVRSNSTTTVMPIFREPPRKSHSVSMRFQYSTSVDSVQMSEQQTLIHKV
ncbi:hypothetical protein GCK72_023584 [Caenorhabditis remanei]|uniref:G-protein coupled receptors family 1 profile domain-containing protein n=1 Tax=Caenorhabditis remanei TaxID=31234 RepID=A0A6A5FX86_CAERE|nr:hypothetical protein GCK72_023584 [Caenorhabditis remanei]KAF1747125.1 hypothetical protein GCK72_023584 [Caenorhabditis remanei]